MRRIPKANVRTCVIGHRGASDEAPENTMPAFRRALELGADGFEFDVQVTSDGQPIVIHDSLLHRTTDDVALAVAMAGGRGAQA